MLPVASRNTLFRCRLCGEKCCGLQPELSEEEVSRIITMFPSFKPYFSPEGRVILLNEKGFCPFLKNGLCSIHKFKPALCRIYPFYPVDKRLLQPFGLPSDAEIIRHNGVEYVFVFDESCPGVGEGDPVDFEGLFKICLEAKLIRP
ncbi:MAG: YkgJ family cysteine cluster protein [Thermoproteota archaeon]